MMAAILWLRLTESVSRVVHWVEQSSGLFDHVGCTDTLPTKVAGFSAIGWHETPLLGIHFLPRGLQGLNLRLRPFIHHRTFILLDRKIAWPNAPLKTLETVLVTGFLSSQADPSRENWTWGYPNLDIDFLENAWSFNCGRGHLEKWITVVCLKQYLKSKHAMSRFLVTNFCTYCSNLERNPS